MPIFFDKFLHNKTWNIETIKIKDLYMWFILNQLDTKYYQLMNILLHEITKKKKKINKSKIYAK